MSLGVWDAALIAAKLLTYAATLGAAGAVWFLRYSGALIASADRRRIRHLVFGASTLALVGGAALIFITAGSMSGAAAGMWDGSLVRMVWQAGAGRANVIRAAGLLLAAVGVLPDRPVWPASLGAAIAATSFAWTGHARSLAPHVLPLVQGVHLVGVAFWLGALAPLLIAAGADGARAAAAAARFGRAALYVVAVLTAAGACLLWSLLGGAAQLWTSPYGRYAMLKLVFVAALLCLAAFNKVRLTPRMLGGDEAALRSFRVSLRCELLMGILILAVTAVLTTAASPPALD